MLFPLPCSSGNLGRVYIKRWTPRFVEWSRRDGFLALVPRERPTLVLPCGHASYRVSIPMPKSDQSLLSSSLTHLGATLGSPALFLFPGWSPEMGAFSGAGPPWSKLSSFSSRSQGSGSQPIPALPCPLLPRGIHPHCQWHFDAYKCQP